MNWSQPVRNLMSTNPTSVEVDAPPSVVAELLATQSFHHLPVLENGTVVGILSPVDLARMSLGVWVENRETAAAWLDSQFDLRDLMTWEPEFVRVDDTVRTAADKLSAGTFHSLPVLDANSELVGMLTSTDLIRAIVQG